MKLIIDSKVLGGILLIVGTSIGGALLVLPVSNAGPGFWYSSLLMTGTWLLTMFAGLLMLEVNLWLPPGSNMISMAQATLGKTGRTLAWLMYLLLLYSLLAAYISGGTGVMEGLFQRLEITSTPWINALIFTGVFGYVVYRGIRTIDHVNRALMFCKLGAYFLLVLLIFPNINMNFLSGDDLTYIPGAFMLIVVSFGFAVIIPSLRGYFDGDVNKLRFVIIIGTSIPLICYILWTLVIMGVVPRLGENGLFTMYNQNYTPIDLVSSLSLSLNKPVITNIAQFFISICILTAFLGVSLCLSDFLADGLNKQKQGIQGLMVHSLTFLPPLILVIFEPEAFVMALRYAGIICILLLILLPMLMAYSGRYIKQMQVGYQAFGGKTLLSLGIFITLILAVTAIYQAI